MMPAPVGIERRGQGYQRGLEFLAQAFFNKALKDRKIKQQQEDLANLGLFGQQTQAYQQDLQNLMPQVAQTAQSWLGPDMGAGAGWPQIPQQPQFPQMQSEMGLQLGMRGQMENLFGQGITPSQQLRQLEYDYLMKLPPDERNKILREKMTKPLVQFGKDWEAGVVGEGGLADERIEKHRKLTQPSPTDRSGFKKTAISVFSMYPKTTSWHIPGPWEFDYNKEQVNKAYEQYLNETGYSEVNENYRRAIRQAWHTFMKQIKQTGVEIGAGANKKIYRKGEIDWDPKDAKVLELERQTATEDMTRLSDEELNRIAEGR